MAIEDLDSFDIQYVDFYAELPTRTRDGVVSDERHDYIDSIDAEITDLHDGADSMTGMTEQQVSALAADQFQEAVLSRTEADDQDTNLFS